MQTTQNETREQVAKTRIKLEQDLAAEQSKLKKNIEQLQKAEASSKQLTTQLAKTNEELEQQKQITVQAESARNKLETELADMQNQLEAQVS